MTIHKQVATITTAGGTGSVNTNALPGGLCRQVYILAGTTSTLFRADVTDDNSVVVRSYGWHQGELNDCALANPFPAVGVHTIRVTDATADGDFTCLMAVQE